MAKLNSQTHTKYPLFAAFWRIINHCGRCIFHII